MGVDVPLGLSRKRIAELVRAEPAIVGYHLVIARRRDREPEAAHVAAAAAAKAGASPAELALKEDVIAWIKAEGRLPRDRSEDKKERFIARWLSDRRREAAEGTLNQAHRDGLAQVPGRQENRRESEAEERWHGRVAQLAAHREEDHDWHRHKDCDSERPQAKPAANLSVSSSKSTSTEQRLRSCQSVGPRS